MFGDFQPFLQVKVWFIIQLKQPIFVEDVSGTSAIHRSGAKKVRLRWPRAADLEAIQALEILAENVTSKHLGMNFGVFFMGWMTWSL